LWLTLSFSFPEDFVSIVAEKNATIPPKSH